MPVLSYFSCQLGFIISGCAAVTPPSQESFTKRLLPAGCKRFQLVELEGATGGFADNAVLGEGGFGRVFRGTLEDGTAIAVKRLDRLGLQVWLYFHFNMHKNNSDF